MAILVRLSSYSEVGMNGLKMAMKLFVADMRKFTEEEGDSNIWLVVWFGVVRQLLVFKIVIYFLERHCRQ